MTKPSLKRWLVNSLTVFYNDLAHGLVALHFFSPDTGYAIGHSGFNPIGNYKSVVLRTVNGGNNWCIVYNSNESRQWCWKIFFINREIGYVSIQNGANDTTFFLKTTNGGLNWFKIRSPIKEAEGIGFVNENTGWIGSDNYAKSFPVYKTIDGGQSWFQESPMKHINKFIFLSDT